MRLVLVGLEERLGLRVLRRGDDRVGVDPEHPGDRLPQLRVVLEEERSRELRELQRPEDRVLALGGQRRVATTTRHIGHVPRVARLGGERHPAPAKLRHPRAWLGPVYPRSS